MRRFLGAANLSINTGNTDSASPSSGSGNQPEGQPLSSTRRAFQQTFAQLAYSRSNSSNTPPSSRPNQQQRKQPPPLTSSFSLENDENISPVAFDSPVPPTPPSKHGHSNNDDGEHEDIGNDHDDASWDDALALPFGSSVIERSSSSSNGHGDHNANSSNNGVDFGLFPSAAGQRGSTSTISASRYNPTTLPMLHSPTTPISNYPGNEGPNSASSMLFSNSQQSQTFNHTGLTVSATYAANASSLVDLKDEMMLELLSSDALIHVAQFEILGFDEVEELRKEHSILSNRLQSLQNKLAIETKIRDAALSISKLYSTKRLSLKTKQIAAEELSNSDKKVDSLINEVNKLSKKENEVKSRIIRHMAAVLALSFRKLEAGQQNHLQHSYTKIQPTGSNQNTFFPSKSDHGTTSSSAASSHTGPYTPLSATFPPPSNPNPSWSNTKSSPERQGFLSPATGLYSPTFSTSSSIIKSKNVQAFEGPHFFANNKDAIVPGALQSSTSTSAPSSSSHAPSARSPSFSNLALFTSSSASSSRSHTPALSQRSPPNNNALLSPTLSTHSTTLGYMDTSNLEMQIQDLTLQLSQSKLQASELENTVDMLKQEKSELALRLEESSSRGTKENDNILRQLHDSQLEIQKLKGELQRANSKLEENMKDASLWEEQSRKLHDGFENERKEMVNRLRSTLVKHVDQRTAISKHLPDADQLQILDMPRFVNRDLDSMLSSMSESHAELANQITVLQQQFSEHQQSSQEVSSKTADEVQKSNRQAEQLQHEKQILMKKITRIESENSEIRSSLKELTDENDNLNSKYNSLKERFEISASQQLDSERRMAQKIKEVDQVHTERMLEKDKILLGVDQDKKSLKNKFESLQSELNEVRNEKMAFVLSLQEVWRNLPSDSTIQARLALKESDDISKYKAVWLNTASSPGSEERTVEPEKLTKRIQSMIELDAKLISRLASHEDHAASHKAASIRAEKMLQESKSNLQAYHKQVKELEEHLTLMNQKEVEMLERLNDLSLALENSRSTNKRSESSIQSLEKKCASMEKEKETLEKKLISLEKEKEKLVNKNEHKVKIADLEKESADLRDELASAQDELDELRSRESRQRVQLLDELTQLTEEASSLRAQLRTAQRKIAATGR